MKNLDLVNRDPNNINDHIEVEFEDVVAEPDGAHSIVCVWKASYCCFNFWKNFWYKLATLCCGICIAAEWGCEFASIAFTHVWFITPLFKVLEIECGCLKKFYGMCVHCCLDPCCESLGLVFSAFKKE
ncbi:hypothetical protein LOTGIDRAFT_189239 [Lottia gigantea]|uniref:Caveolin n=1 Tax=Lottia gigantea TaxID=225164 RepID=V4ALP9_LOTGI|nr:hypothetical protein LOTGIDRAFT_189239 [Lottia gigantea]ESO94516.1 hypothetical protein LOTGIDRAFT_189239 [Lottia gigantea]